MVEIFGDTLYTCENDSLKKFPSPESLKRRIIISTKPPKEYLQTSNESIIKGEDDDSLLKGHQDSSEDEIWGKELPNFVENFVDQSDKVHYKIQFSQVL